MFPFLRHLHLRLICALLVWVVLLAQWGAIGHVLQHWGTLSRAAASSAPAPAALTALSFEAKQNPSGDTAATTHAVCAWCLNAAQVLGAVVLNSAPRPSVSDFQAELKSVSRFILTVISAFTAYRSRAPPAHKLM
jgi:hypothetical protein